MSHESAPSLRRRALLRQAHRHVPARISPFRLRCCTEFVTRLGKGLVMALLRRTRLVRFCTQVPTFVKRPEREILIRSRPSELELVIEAD